MGIEWGTPATLYLGAVVAVLWLIQQFRRSLWFLSLLVWPGTLCHEASHWVVARLTNGQPHGFSVWPRRVGRGYVLGSVSLGHVRWYNAFFIGLSPLGLLPLAYAGLVWRLGRQPHFDLQEALAVYLIANLAYSAIPSGQDLRVAARSPVGWLLLTGFLAWHFLR